jgi:hypothetical protein
MTTFSQLVDEITREVRRPDLLLDIATYLNQTIREMHFDPKTGAAAEFIDNLKEVQVTATVDTGFGWDIPNQAVFQRMLAVRYDSIFTNDAKTTYIQQRSPGPGMSGQHLFWYRAGPRVTFAGYGGVGGVISIAYFEYPRSLKYYTLANRPAERDLDLGWTYAPVFDTTDELREAAQFYTSNWMLERWEVIVAEGVRAKVYKRIADTERARTCYASFMAMRAGVYTGEVAR